MRFLSVLMAITLPATAAAQSLDLSGECPGTLDFDISGVTPSGNYALLTANGQGNQILGGGPCAGTELELDSAGLTLRTTRSADANGNALLTPNLPLGGCDMAVQILDLTTCTTSPSDFIPRPVTLTTITDLQAGTHLVFDVLRLEGVVTATTNFGIFVQEAGSSLPGSGTYVHLGANWDLSWGLLNRGDAVEVTGEYREYFDLTEINVIDSPSGAVFITGVGVVPPAAVLTLADLAVNPESWEGVLIEITSPMVSGLPDAFGAWVVSDGSNPLVVDDDMYSPASLTIGQTFTSITGPLSYSFSEYRLLPRDAGDLL